MSLLGWPLMLAAAPLVGLAFELLLLRTRWTPYFTSGFPLHLDLVPIVKAPEGEGTTASVCWTADEEGLVHWWANARSGEGLTGLHGVVRCYRSRRGVELVFRWSPPWSPLLAAAALAVFGAIRGLPHVTIPVAVAMILGLVFVYHQGALRAAAELRWSFVSGGGEAGDDAES